MCKVSVVMSVYNAEKYIRKAIDSVLGQTFTDFEFIILDNGSTDASAEIINSYQDSRIRFLSNGMNLGISGSLNKGIDASKGEYIARIDADDVAYLDRFEKQVRYLDENRNVCLCSGRYATIIGEKEKKTRIQDGLNLDQMRFMQYFWNEVDHSSVMMRKDVLDKYNLRYRTEYPGAQDYGLWMELIRYGDMAVLKDRMSKYRIHDTNTSKNVSMMEDDCIRIQDRAYRFIELFEDEREYLIKANHGGLETPDELYKLGLLLAKYYEKCRLDFMDDNSRKLLEYAYYIFLKKYFYMGYAVYKAAIKSGVFRFNSEWRWKALIRSLLKYGGRMI